MYGGIEKLTQAEQARKLLDDIYSSPDLPALYRHYREEEIRGFEILKKIDSEYEGVLNRDNVNDVIAAAKAKLKNNPEENQNG